MTQSEKPEADDAGRNENSEADGAVSKLPSSHGRSFSSLDEYLTHLRERAGPIGQAWYREIKPGVYQYVTTRTPPGPPVIVTRKELMERFGFKH